MSLEGLSAVLGELKKTHWQEQQSFETFLTLWPDIVGLVVSAQTRPLKLTAQGVLHVATSSGAWAQNLAFERVRILEKVNAVWNQPIKDIYFSTRGWHQSQPRNLSGIAEVTHQNALHRTPLLRLSHTVIKPKSAHDAFLQWSKTIQKRATQGYVFCASCGCPSPPEELQRWRCCALCASRSWQREPQSVPVSEDQPNFDAD
ncbi:MAG TPA: DUF721 domain-containing protein [Stenomitos sp.]